jgi:hypothetical protein
LRNEICGVAFFLTTIRSKNRKKSNKNITLDFGRRHRIRIFRHKLLNANNHFHIKLDTYTEKDIYNLQSRFSPSPLLSPIKISLSSYERVEEAQVVAAAQAEPDMRGELRKQSQIDSDRLGLGPLPRTAVQHIGMQRVAAERKVGVVGSLVVVGRFEVVDMIVDTRLEVVDMRFEVADTRFEVVGT